MLSCTWQPLDKCSHALLRQMLSCTWQPLDKSLGASLCHILQCTPSTYALPPHAPACAPLRFSATPFRAHPPSMPCDQAPLHTPQPPKSLPLQAPQHAPYLSALPLCPPTLCFSLSHPPCTTAGTTPPTLHLSWSHTPHVAPHIAPELAHATHLPCTTTLCPTHLIPQLVHAGEQGHGAVPHIPGMVDEPVPHLHLGILRAAAQAHQAALGACAQHGTDLRPG